MNNLHLILVDPKPALCRAFQKAFHGLPNVEIVQGYFERLPAFDCMVSAANSFGLMDGGLAAAVHHRVPAERPAVALKIVLF
jgi:hypothetical protein